MCVIEGCDKPIYVKSRGLCTKHYSRLLSTGTTDDGLKARKPTTDRFWDKVAKGDSCWEWTGMTNNYGYGLIQDSGRNGKRWFAHRYSWYIHNGDIPEPKGYHGAVVRHKCDNRLCVNPEHLEIGTQVDNVNDMDDRGRRVSVGSGKRTHCKRGHELNADNTYVRPSNGARCCAICKKNRRYRYA